MDLSVRYERQMILPQIGSTGQALLARARVLCVGLGGLGSPAALYLAAAGVIHLGLLDDDEVSLSNLQRQILYRTQDCGHKKAIQAREHLQAMNNDLSLEVLPVRLSVHNVCDIFSRYDIIVDCTDNFSSKFLINDAAVKLGLSVVYAAISGFEGQISVFDAKNGPCFRCLHQTPPKSKIQNCAQAGILGSVAGILGCMQATEVIKLILRSHPPAQHLKPLIGELAVLDVTDLSMRHFKINKNPHCCVCSIPKENIHLTEETATCSTLIHEHKIQQINAQDVFLGDWQKKYQLIDVRELDEFNLAHIPGAIHWPLSLIEQGTVFPVNNSNKPIVLYCQAGKRSLRAASLVLEKTGVACLSLHGGISAI